MIKGKYVSIVLITLLLVSTVFIPVFTHQKPVGTADIGWNYVESFEED